MGCWLQAGFRADAVATSWQVGINETYFNLTWKDA